MSCGSIDLLFEGSVCNTQTRKAKTLVLVCPLKNDHAGEFLPYRCSTFLQKRMSKASAMLTSVIDNAKDATDTPRRSILDGL